MGLFTRKLKIKDFKVGDIYKMEVGKRSHVSQPYYVRIAEVGIDYIVTEIPKEHSLRIDKDKNLNWGYQIPRMTYAEPQNTRLLYNQKLIHD